MDPTQNAPMPDVVVKPEPPPADAEDMLVAPTSRASRAARSPPPSEEAEKNAWMLAARYATALEAEGLTRLERQPVIVFAAKPGRGGGGGGGGGGSSSRSDYAGSAARPAPTLSHVFSLQRPIESNARESSFLAYESVLPLEGPQLASGGMRSNSVRASVVFKARKTQGGGQQTTRNSLQDMSASIAAQSTSIAIAMGIAKQEFGNASNPAATSARSAAPLVDGQGRHEDVPFVMTSSTRLLPHALPTRLASHNLLTTMQQFATSELEAGAIRSLVPQQVTSLRAICNQITDKTDGVSIWAAWVLLVHMLSDPRLRRLVQASPITDSEVAVAYLFTNYARAEVTRRARMDQVTSQKEAGKGSASQKSKKDAKKSHNPLQVQIDAQASSDKQTLSLKRKRPPCSGVVQVSGGILDYWSAALTSQYSSILKLMITQSKALANQASIQTLMGQAPAGFDAERNKLLVNISSTNAVKSAEALSSLVVTTPERVPRIVTWRCRNKEGKMAVHTGLVRSQSDASNTTLHAVTMPEPGVQEPSGHHVVLWSMAVRNSTPHDASTSLMPGVVEGIQYHHLVDRSQLPLRNKFHQTRILDAVKQRTTRAACDGSLDVALTGVARGFVVVRAKLVVSESQVAAGKAIAARMQLRRSTPRSARATWRSTTLRPTPFSSRAHLRRVRAVRHPGLQSRACARGQRAGAHHLAVQVPARRPVQAPHGGGLAGGDGGARVRGARPPADAPAHCRLRRRVCGQGRSRREAARPPRRAPAPGRHHPHRVRRLRPCAWASSSLRALRRRRRCCKVRPGRRHAVALLRGPRARASAARRARPSSTTSPPPSRPGTSTPPSPPPSASSWATSTCACCLSLVPGKFFCDFEPRTHAHTHGINAFACPRQVYRVGTSNVPRSFETTAVVRACGEHSLHHNYARAGTSYTLKHTHRCGLRHRHLGVASASAPRRSRPTNGAQSRVPVLTALPPYRLTTSWQEPRQAPHGPGEQVDEWCAESAKAHYMKVSDTHYAAIPREARGVPHSTIPGVHAYLDDYADAMEHARTLLDIEDRRTVDSLQCLPLGPFAERQPPHISEQSDPTVSKRFRNPDDAVRSEGRAFQVDATCEDVAITREPLIPSVAITSPQDCIFGQSQPFISSVLGAVAALDQIARCAYLNTVEPGVAETRAPETEAHLLYVLLKCYFSDVGEQPPHGLSHYWAATAVVYLNAIFTSGHLMAADTIVEAHALGRLRAPSA